MLENIKHLKKYKQLHTYLKKCSYIIYSSTTNSTMIFNARSKLQIQILNSEKIVVILFYKIKLHILFALQFFLKKTIHLASEQNVVTGSTFEIYGLPIVFIYFAYISIVSVVLDKCYLS